MKVQLSKLSKELQEAIRGEVAALYRRRGFKSGTVNGEVNQTEVIIRQANQEIVMDWEDFEYILKQYEIMKKDRD